MNVFIYSILLLLFVVIQSSVLNMFLPAYMTPDLVAIFVVYASMNRKYLNSIVAIFLCSYVLAIYSSESFYIIAVSLLITFGVSRYITINFYTRKIYYMTLGMFLSIFSGKLFVLIWTGFGGFVLFMEHFLYLFIQSVVTAFIGLLLFKFFKLIDIKTRIIEEETVKAGESF